VKAPIKKLKKSDIEWLADNRCRAHGMPFLEHYNCWIKEQPASPITERIGCLDIESSNLKASFGIVLSYCIKEMDGPIDEYVIKPSQLKDGSFDRELLKKFYHDAGKFHRLVVYWGKDRRHDVPFLRTRAMKQGVDFPLYKEILVVDLYDWVKNKMSLHSSRLATACEELGIEAKGHKLSGDIWLKALSGDAASLNWILEHNREDVRSTEALYKRLEPFVMNRKVSI
jgi:uncharacterized protein YprB with RNaseH-like and TPR domain